MLLVCLMAAGPVVAGPRWSSLAATVFHNYGRDQGLPHPVPTALAQDRDGFIWIGTQGGLARWDGYRFRAYGTDSTRPGSLPDGWIQTLHVDPAGRLWIGGGAGGLARYDALRDRFVRIPLGPAGQRMHIGAIADDGHGGLWIGSDAGLHHLDPATGRARKVPGAFGNAPVRALLRDRHGTLWAGTTAGLARRAAGTNRFEAVPVGDETSRITALLEDGEGHVWIGTTRRGLFVIDRPGARARPVSDDPTLATGSISTISRAGGREIWAGLRGNGIVAVDVVTGQLRFIRHDRTVANSLAHNDVWTLLRDDAGSMWVGSTGGLSYHPHSSGLIATVFGSAEQPRGLSASDPLSILVTRDGHVWLGYIDGGVDVIDPIRGRIAALRPGTGDGRSALPPDVVFAMAEGDDGAVYIGTRRGLYRTDLAARRVGLVDVPGRAPRSAVTALAFDKGILWIGGEDDGLMGMMPQGGPRGTGSIVFGRPEATKLGDGGINVIMPGSEGDLWIGTRNGLARIDLATRTIAERIGADPADPTALPARFVVALLTDRQGRLWVGTFGGGIAMLTNRDRGGRPRFLRFGLSDGLPHLNIDSLAMDGAGTIWAGTDEGLARIDPASLAIRAVRQADGSALVDYFASAAASAPAGEALFGAKGGLTVVKPGLLPRWTLQPRIVVTDLRVGASAVPAARFNRDGAAAPVIVRPDANSLAIEFAALDFTAPERNRYAYRLEGFDRDWTETDAGRRLAIYTNLPPGTYTLHLRGSNRAGVWTERELSLPIRVIPAWYQRLWFKLAGALLLVMAIIAIVRWRTRYLRGRQADLERQIADRTADLRAVNERLEQLAMTDPLTGCANRRHFMAVAEDMIAAARTEGWPLSLTILDLDDFKRINDDHGHPGGDAMLAMAGGLLLERARPDDLVGRIGGEEFALLMPRTGLAEAQTLAERLRKAVAAASIELGGAPVGITTSMGVAMLRPDEDLGRFYARADAALYAAKAAGRNRVEAVSPAE